MSTTDRIIFSTIALALLLIALRPYFAEGERGVVRVDISHVAGRPLSFGAPLPVITK